MNKDWDFPLFVLVYGAVSLVSFYALEDTILPRIIFILVVLFLVIIWKQREVI